MDAVTFNTVIHDGKIDVPQKYMQYFASMVRVILLKEDEPVNNESSKKERLAALNRLSGLLKDSNISLDEARAERLSRQ